MKRPPTFEFHVARAVRDRCGFDDPLFALSGNVVLANLTAVRAFAAKLDEARGAVADPERAVKPGALAAMGLIDEALHVVVAAYRETRDARAMTDALAWFEARLGRAALDRTLLAFAEEFPTVSVYRGRQSAAAWLEAATAGVSHRAVALEELLLLWLANANPAFAPFRELFDDTSLAAASAYRTISADLRAYFETRPRFGPDAQNLIDLLRAPALASPDSLEGQLDYIREHWRMLIGGLLERLLRALDVLREEERALYFRLHPPTFDGGHAIGDSGPGAVLRFDRTGHDPEFERFSPDQEWMPRAVVIAKSTFVWLDQLSRRWGRVIARLDQIPDEELDTLAARGFNGLWLIGLWERSRASQRIKQLCGNPDAAASAYALDDYRIADELGGDPAYANLRDRCSQRGIRLASDMVPNHMGLDSHWVVEHPEWFLSLDYCPYPSYSFAGVDLSNDPRVGLWLEDHYYDRTDAAVVFKRLDRGSGEVRYVYHGNDGTSFPWNDTAQLDYLNPATREAVIQTILEVARRFPIIRFDAAMVLSKKHYQRLWFPEPGTGGAIPTRAERGMTRAQFDGAMPVEFWREVVDRVAAEAPGTLLLAEAFWMMEGYFVRTLGMHRVYNSAFMNMLRDEQNANYRSVIRNTVEFDPEILKRYVNFMNNPDERTAVDQFGRGGKYFGICTLMSTLPGMPMFGHGQVEGLTEKYGMEYRRAYLDEAPDDGLVAEHQRRIAPLLHRRALFAEAHEFLMYDCLHEHGHVIEDVFAYSNRAGGERALVLYHNVWGSAAGGIRTSCATASRRADGTLTLRRRTLAEGLDLDSAHPFVRCRDLVSGLEHLWRTRELVERGLWVELGAYECRVLLDWNAVAEDGRPWSTLCDELGGRGAARLDERLAEIERRALHHAFHAAMEVATVEDAPTTAVTPDPAPAAAAYEARVLELIQESERFAHGAGARAAGLDPTTAWRGDALAVARAARVRFEFLAPLLAGFDPPEPHASRAADPATSAANAPAAPPPHADRAAVLAATIVCAALGAAAAPADPERAAAELFDTLALRPAVHAVLARRIPDDATRWRLAAEVRSALAHAGWARATTATPPEAPWHRDTDVQWLIGVHEVQGVRWFREADFRDYVEWIALVATLEAAGAPESLPRQLRRAQTWIEARLAEARAAGWKFDALIAAPEASPTAAHPAPRSSR